MTTIALVRVLLTGCVFTSIVAHGRWPYVPRWFTFCLIGIFVVDWLIMGAFVWHSDRISKRIPGEPRERDVLRAIWDYYWRGVGWRGLLGYWKTVLSLKNSTDNFGQVLRRNFDELAQFLSVSTRGRVLQLLDSGQYHEAAALMRKEHNRIYRAVAGAERQRKRQVQGVVRRMHALWPRAWRFGFTQAEFVESLRKLGSESVAKNLDVGERWLPLVKEAETYHCADLARDYFQRNDEDGARRMLASVRMLLQEAKSFDMVDVVIECVANKDLLTAKHLLDTERSRRHRMAAIQEYITRIQRLPPSVGEPLMVKLAELETLSETSRQYRKLRYLIDRELEKREA